MNPYSAPSLAGVPALTLLNPWAMAIARLGKTVENRTWAPTGTTRLLIHAGKGDDEAGYEYLVHRLGQRYDQLEEWVVPSAIVAVADLARVCHVAETGVRCECPPLWAQPGQVHWLLEDVTPLPEPAPCRGFLGLWHPQRDTLDAVVASLALVEWEPITCRGRRVTGSGAAQGSPCGETFIPARGETYRHLEQRARTQGWKVAVREQDGPVPDAMCPRCGGGSA